MSQYFARQSRPTSSVHRDIDSAAKFVGAGAAIVGCAGSGWIGMKMNFLNFFTLRRIYDWLNQFSIHLFSVVNFDCTGRADGRYASGDCQSEYFACSGQVAYGFVCPARLVFSRFGVEII